MGRKGDNYTYTEESVTGECFWKGTFEPVYISNQ